MKYLILTFLLTLTLGRVVAQDCANFLEFDVITVPHESDPCLMTTKIVFHTPDEQYFDIGSFEFEFELSAEVDNIQCNFGFSVDFCPSGTDDRIFFEHDSPINSEELECDQCEDDFPNVNPEFNFISFDHSFDQCIDFEFWDGTFDDGTGNNNSRCIRPSDRILNEDYCEEEFEYDGYTVCIEITSDDENCTLPDTEVIGNNTCGTTNSVLTNAEGEACVPVPEGGCTEIEVDCPCVFSEAVDSDDLFGLQQYILANGTLDPLAIIIANVGLCTGTGNDDNLSLNGIDLVELQKLILKVYSSERLEALGCNPCLTIDPEVLADFDPQVDPIPPFGTIEICEGDDPVSVISVVLGDVDFSCSPECGMKRNEIYSDDNQTTTIEFVQQKSKLVSKNNVKAYSLTLNLQVNEGVRLDDVVLKDFGPDIIEEAHIVGDRLVVLLQSYADIPFSLRANETLIEVNGMDELIFHNEFADYNQMFFIDGYHPIGLVDARINDSALGQTISYISKENVIELTGDLSNFSQVEVYDMIGRLVFKTELDNNIIELPISRVGQILNIILIGKTNKSMKVLL